MRSTSIYALVDADGRYRYVGKSIDVKRRFAEHQRRFQWAVAHEILEICDTERASREKHWITYGRENGWPLENIAEGGGGGAGSGRPVGRKYSITMNCVITSALRNELTSEALRHHKTLSEVIRQRLRACSSPSASAEF